MPKKSTGLPKYVKLSNGQYVYRPYYSAKERIGKKTDKYGYLRPPIRLGDKNTPIHKIHAAYAAAIEQLKYQAAEDDAWGYMTVGWLSGQYMKSRWYSQLAGGTQKLYKKCLVLLQHPIEINGQEAKLGDLGALQLKTTTIRRILDRRLERYQEQGLKGESRCNHEKALLSAMYRYGIQYFDQLADIKNPSHGISKFKVAVRERYVEDDDYALQYEMACDKSPPYIPIVMELAYLLASRGIETTDLTIGSATDVGVIVARRKGSKDTIVRWSDRLKQAWGAALNMHVSEPKSNNNLLINKNNFPVTKDAIDSAWQRLKKHMEEGGHADIYFQLHDLKRKGISDAKDDRIAGHVSPSIRANYNVKLREYDAPK